MVRLYNLNFPLTHWLRPNANLHTANSQRLTASPYSLQLSVRKEEAGSP